jgi:calcineurin-like phosphoesterase family protein
MQDASFRGNVLILNHICFYRTGVFQPIFKNIIKECLMARFFTSDQHFGCPAGLYYIFGRPFANSTEQDYAIVQNWNDVVSYEDDVYILGDISVGDNLLSVAPFLKLLKGNKFLILGHHDYNPEVVDNVYRDAGIIVLDGSVVSQTLGTSFGDVEVLLSHFPYYHTGSENPYSDSYVKTDDAQKPLLHGHRHHNTPLNPHSVLEYNVSVDANSFTPVHESTIVGWLEWLHSGKHI